MIEAGGWVEEMGYWNGIQKHEGNEAWAGAFRGIGGNGKEFGAWRGGVVACFLVFWSFLDVLEVSSRGGMVARYPRQTANELRDVDKGAVVAEKLEPTDICLIFHVFHACLLSNGGDDARLGSATTVWGLCRRFVVQFQIRFQIDC